MTEIIVFEVNNPIFFTRKGVWTPALFKLNYLYFPWFKLKNFSAQQMENFLRFSKLTQLLSVGQFLRPLEAFKTKRQVSLVGAVQSF